MINPSAIGFPDEETMSCEDGLVENHHYSDFRGMTPAFYREVREAENALLATDETFDPDDPENEDLMGSLLGLDPGVATTVVALSVIGACPVTSCSGQEGHYETHPLVYTWCDEEQLALIEQAADYAGVEVVGVGDPGIMICMKQGSLHKMRAFAEGLVHLWLCGSSPEQMV